MNYTASIDWLSVKAVVLDIDGTLYDQSRLRKKMAFALAAHYSVRPWRLREMQILRHFRAEREKHKGYAGGDLENVQYDWCAKRGNYPLEQVKQVVNRWIFIFPNRYLADCTYPGVKSLFVELKARNIKIAIYSDYKAHDKMHAMGLEADLIVSSTDSFVDRLKPDPKGLIYIANKLQVTSQECLFIGDRPELDGACAINAHMPYLIVDKKPYNSFDFYHRLVNTIPPITPA